MIERKLTINDFQPRTPSNENDVLTKSYADSNYVISNEIRTIVKLTQAEYDALTPVETTLYIIVEE